MQDFFAPFPRTVALERSPFDWRVQSGISDLKNKRLFKCFYNLKWPYCSSTSAASDYSAGTSPALHKRSRCLVCLPNIGKDNSGLLYFKWRETSLSFFCDSLGWRWMPIIFDINRLSNRLLGFSVGSPLGLVQPLERERVREREARSLIDCLIVGFQCKLKRETPNKSSRCGVELTKSYRARYRWDRVAI